MHTRLSALALAFAAACSGGSSPTAPKSSPPPASSLDLHGVWKVNYASSNCQEWHGQTTILQSGDIFAFTVVNPANPEHQTVEVRGWFAPVTAGGLYPFNVTLCGSPANVGAGGSITSTEIGIAFRSDQSNVWPNGCNCGQNVVSGTITLTR
jgi:hypothetical protein